MEPTTHRDYRDLITAIDTRLHDEDYESIEEAESDIQLLLLHAKTLREELESKAVLTAFTPTGARWSGEMVWECDLCGATSPPRPFNELGDVWVTHDPECILWTAPSAEDDS